MTITNFGATIENKYHFLSISSPGLFVRCHNVTQYICLTRPIRYNFCPYQLQNVTPNETSISRYIISINIRKGLIIYSFIDLS